jgi:translation initiation factor IF-3
MLQTWKTGFPLTQDVVYTGTDDYYACPYIWPFRLSTREFTPDRTDSGAPLQSLKTTHSMYPPRNFPPRRQNRRENVNESIRAREVRAVFPDGATEIMPTAAALRRAQELGLDLVLIAPTAVPPVAKAVDYGHYQYEQKKKQHDAKKKQHVVQVKELKFRPNTDDHDYDFKKNHAIRFLQEGNRVKAVVQFRGREIAHADLGKKLLIRFAGDLTAYGAVEGSPRLEGRNAHILISPVKAAVKPEKPAGEKPGGGGPQVGKPPSAAAPKPPATTPATQGEKAPQPNTAPASEA